MNLISIKKQILFISTAVILSSCNVSMTLSDEPSINPVQISMTFSTSNQTSSNNIKKIVIAGSGTVNIDWNNNTEIETHQLKSNGSEFIYEYPSTTRAVTVTITGGNIKRFECSGNRLTNLKIDGNSMLKELDCSDNRLTALIVGNNTVLEKLILENQSNNNGKTLSDLNVSNTALKQLDCSNHNLKNLDISSISSLKELNCSNNSLESLIVGENNKALILVDCSENSMRTNALNNLFGVLPKNNISGVTKTINITNNNGSNNCNKDLAVGWNVVH